MVRRESEFAGLDETTLLVIVTLRAETAIIEGRGETELEGFRNTVEALLEPRNAEKLRKRLNALQLEIERQRILAPAADRPRDWRWVEYGIVLQEAARGKLLRYERVRVQ